MFPGFHRYSGTSRRWYRSELPLRSVQAGIQGSLQNAEKNDWIQKDSWLNNTGTKFEVAFGDRKVTSVLYDIDVVGYENGLNKLHLFDIETVDESLVKKGITFDKEAIEKNLTLFLYPDDSDEAGNLLRIYQEYFMVCNGAQLILKEVKEKAMICILCLNMWQSRSTIPILLWLSLS